MYKVGQYIDGLRTIFFPELCICCQWERPIKGDEFCVYCLEELPLTTHFEIKENDFFEKFYGRVPIEFGAAWINFYSGSVIKDMLHALKYRKKKIIGQHCGTLIGNCLAECLFFKKPDVIIPIPIHYKKKYVRGFNQAALIAHGISEVLNIPVREDILVKEINTKTQTQKSRQERTKDLKDTLQLKNIQGLEGKHILIVDDVMTTGATFEAAALTLQEIPDVRFSMVSLAITKTN